MAAYTIRRAQRNEGKQIARLWGALLKEQEGVDARFRVSEDAVDRWMNDYPLWIQDETRRIFVAEQGDDLVGFISAQRYGPPPIYQDAAEVFIDEVYVADAQRGQGVGAGLVDAVREWAGELQADRLRLTYLTSNEAARSFWEKQQATPFYTTMTIELVGEDRASREEQRKQRRIGF